MHAAQAGGNGGAAPGRHWLFDDFNALLTVKLKNHPAPTKSFSMNGTLFIFSINVTLALVMAASFIAIARFDPRNVAARWMALAFGFGGLSIAAEFAITAGILVTFVHMVVALSFLAGMLAVVVALSHHYRTARNWTALGTIFAASALLYALTLAMDRNDLVRQILYQLPYALVSLLALAHVWRSARRGALDWLLMGLFTAGALVFAGKALLANMIGGVGDRASDYANTVYALISQSSGAVLVLMMGMTLLVMLGWESAGRLARQAERDPITGFLNRNGFLTHGDTLLRQLDADDSAALILCALDGQSENDTRDADIRALVTLFETTTDARIARIGPTHFALLIPRTNLLGARQKADALRRRIAARDGGTPARFPTASFGVTERERGDALSDMILRADWALEEARLAGGNCVRLSARAALGSIRPRAVN